MLYTIGGNVILYIQEHLLNRQYASLYYTIVKCTRLSTCYTMYVIFHMTHL